MVEKRKALISVREYIDEIVLGYSCELASCKQVGQCIKESYLKTLVEKKKQKYKVSSEISHSTIRQRSWRGIAKLNGGGVKSPLAGAEKALVAICIQTGKIRQPLNCTDAIELMNNLIQDTDSQKGTARISKNAQAWV